MDWKKLIEQELRRRNSLLDQRNGYTAEQRTMVDALADDESLSEANQKRFDELNESKRSTTALIDACDAKLEELRAAQADDERITRAAQDQHDAAPAPALGTYARTSNREATYSRRSNLQDGVSFFRDLLLLQRGAPSQEVQQRIQAHEGEARDADRISKRAVTTGSLGGVIPPQYLVDQFAAIARAGRPTANLVNRLPLPEVGMTLDVPRGTTGTTAAVQATQNSNVSSNDYAVTDLTIPVATIAGQSDVSRQAIERGVNTDEIIWADLAAAYAVALDQQVLSGTGTSGQMLGILKTSGVTQMSAFTAAADAASFYKKFAGAIAAVATSRFMAPSGALMHPNRWGWLSSLVDSSNRPLVVPNPNGPTNAAAVYDKPEDTPSTVPVGWMQGLPIYTDANIPTAVGTGPEDQVAISRLEDLILWEEGDGSPTQLRFEQTLGNQLTVKLVAYGYAAFTAGRYPAATSIIGGNAGTAGYGLVAPSF